MLLIAAAIPSIALRIQRMSELKEDYTHPHRYFSAYAMLGRATCDQGIDHFLTGALQRDGYGNPYLWECNARGFTVVSAGPDGIYDTADDVRSDR
ncbi:MAG: hypothetical protein JO257_12420 [Deltaproteobacteria bacterium]|nr:hypothetical protein [Deltaproteobacteria bacterium]